MSLLELVDNERTDKNTIHSYLPLYEELLKNKKHTAENVLEIGIGDDNQGITNGGSIKLWKDYFTKSTVHAVEIRNMDRIWEGIKNDDRIVIYDSTDAYSKLFVDSLKNQNIHFDMILDDGPHTLVSMIECILRYYPLLKDDGILIIEDVQSIEWLHILIAVVPDELKNCVQIYDLRKEKNRYDDIVFTINKSLL